MACVSSLTPPGGSVHLWANCILFYLVGYCSFIFQINLILIQSFINTIDQFTQLIMHKVILYIINSCTDFLSFEWTRSLYIWYAWHTIVYFYYGLFAESSLRFEIILLCIQFGSFDDITNSQVIYTMVTN